MGADSVLIRRGKVGARKLGAQRTEERACEDSRHLHARERGDKHPMTLRPGLLASRTVTNAFFMFRPPAALANQHSRTVLMVASLKSQSLPWTVSKGPLNLETHWGVTRVKACSSVCMEACWGFRHPSAPLRSVPRRRAHRGETRHVVCLRALTLCSCGSCPEGRKHTVRGNLGTRGSCAPKGSKRTELFERQGQARSLPDTGSLVR